MPLVKLGVFNKVGYFLFQRLPNQITLPQKMKLTHKEMLFHFMNKNNATKINTMVKKKVINK